MKRKTREDSGKQDFTSRPNKRAKVSKLDTSISSSAPRKSKNQKASKKNRKNRKETKTSSDKTNDMISVSSEVPQTHQCQSNKTEQGRAMDVNCEKPHLERTGSASGKRKMGSCMKHKRKDKTPQHRRKSREKDKTKEMVKSANHNDKEAGPRTSDNDKKLSTAGKVQLPKSPEDYSSNWKKLSKILETQKKDQPSSKPGGYKQYKHHRKNKTSKTDTSKSSVTSVLTENAPEIWFDDVDEILIESTKPKSQTNVPTDQASESQNPLVKPQSYEGVTKVVAIDCEMVGVGDLGKDSILARVSVVNQYGQCVYDEHVKATEKVTDYRTAVSGVRRQDLEKGKEFSVVQKEVCDMLKGRVLVGHAIHHDLQALFLDHPRKKIRDTSMYKPFRSVCDGRTPSLKKLSQKLLKVAVQEGEHSSVQDAQATMRLYTMYRKQWEKDIREGKHKPRLVKEKKRKKRNVVRLKRLKQIKSAKTA